MRARSGAGRAQCFAGIKRRMLRARMYEARGINSAARRSGGLERERQDRRGATSSMLATRSVAPERASSARPLFPFLRLFSPCLVCSLSLSFSRFVLSPLASLRAVRPLHPGMLFILHSPPVPSPTPPCAMPPLPPRARVARKRAV